MDNNMEDNNETNEIGQSAEVSRQKRMLERLKEPIVLKNSSRKTKTNLNAFRAQFFTLKKDKCASKGGWNGTRFPLDYEE